MPESTPKPSGSLQLDLAVGDVHTPTSVGIVQDYGATKEPRLSDAALCIVLNDEGRIACVTRPEPPHEMSIPGGHVEPGERPDAAAAREIKEELGLDVTGLRHLASLKSPLDGRTVHVFRADAWSGELRAVETGSRAAWLTLGELREQVAADGQRIATRFSWSLWELEYAGAFNLSDRVNLISAKKRNALPDSSFALPKQRKYPLDTAPRVRNATARLEQMKKAGKVSSEEYAEAKKRIAAAAKKFGVSSEYNAPKKRKPAGAHVHVRADIAPGGSVHVHHNMRSICSADGSQRIDVLANAGVRLRDVRPIRMDDAEVDPASVGVTLKKATWKDGTPKKLVWVQLAVVGEFKGHPSGPFKLTPEVFAEIKSNFERRGIPIQYDMEHASEMDASEGSIPVTGAPAQGWVHRMDNRGAAGLWGLTEWRDYAREGIQDGAFGYMSPAIYFNAKDPVTGEKVGARMTSVAITNHPFLSGQVGLHAARESFAGANAIAMASKGLDRTHKQPHEYMPQVRACLRLPELADHAACQDALDSLRDCCEMADANGMHEGRDIGAYMNDIADLVGAPPHMTWGAMLDLVEEMIDAAMRAHVEEYHEGGASMRDTAPTETTMPELTLADAQKQITTLTTEKTTLAEEKKTLASDKATLEGVKTELETKVTGLETEVATLKGETGTLSTQLKEVQVKADVAGAIVDAVSKVVTLKEGETIDKAVERIAAENATLLKDKETRDEAELQRLVSSAFRVYKEPLKLSDGAKQKEKENMLRLARLDLGLFANTYPPVEPDQEYLLKTIAPSVDRPKTENETESLTGLTQKLMSEKKLGYAAAYDEACRILRERKRAAGVR